MYQLEKRIEVSKEAILAGMLECELLSELVKKLYGVNSSTAKYRFHSAIGYFKLQAEFKLFKLKEKTNRGRVIDINTVLVKDSKISQSALRDLIKRNKILERKCSECDLDEVWNNKKLNLQLDHINGDNKNNELSNLRLLCPNCHSQTPTYCRGMKNLGKSKKPCSICKVNKIKVKATICRQCWLASTGKNKIKKLELADLNTLLENYALMEICEKFNCSYINLKLYLDENNIKTYSCYEWTAIRSTRPPDYTLMNSILEKYSITQTK